tara:strand:+ start:38 stop:334 length:297 start_codon:yes stop_codon:yes gene_type:complete
MNVIYTTKNCFYCKLAKELMEQRGIEFEEKIIGKDIEPKIFKEKFNVTKAPLIFIDGKQIGGYGDLWTGVYKDQTIAVKKTAAQRFQELKEKENKYVS